MDLRDSGCRYTAAGVCRHGRPCFMLIGLVQQGDNGRLMGGVTLLGLLAILGPDVRRAKGKAIPCFGGTFVNDSSRSCEKKRNKRSGGRTRFSVGPWTLAARSSTARGPPEYTYPDRVGCSACS